MTCPCVHDVVLKISAFSPILPMEMVDLCPSPVTSGAAVQAVRGLRGTLTAGRPAMVLRSIIA